MSTDIVSFSRYRRIEAGIIKKISQFLRHLKNTAAGRCHGAGRAMIRPYTLTLIPHSGKRFRSIHVTPLSFVVFQLFLILLTGTCVWYAVSYYSARKNLADRSQELLTTEKAVRDLEDEGSRLRASIEALHDTLLGTFTALGLPPPSPPLEAVDMDDLYRFSFYLADSKRQLAQLGKVIKFHSAMIAEIPCIWPVKGGGGYITAPFGAALHPISGHHYLHRGIDISTRRQGDPVVAAANGQIVAAEFDAGGGLGNTVIIKHNHGFYSRYGHLLSFPVKLGQKVKQGEVIGFIGNTGLSTGPHLHYEIHWGSELVDPLEYINRRPFPPSAGPEEPSRLAEAAYLSWKNTPAAACQ
jgi:hypothetical protein